MQNIYEKVADFLLEKIRPLSVQIILIMALVGFSWWQMETRHQEQKAEIARVIDDFRAEKKEKETYLRSYIDCEKSSSVEVRKALERVELQLSRIQ